MTRRYRQNEDYDAEPYYPSDEGGEYCEVCQQDYLGRCPINSADCPYAYQSDGDDPDEDDEDEDLADFEDIDDVDALLGYDEEAERLIEEDADIPPEDLKDEDESENLFDFDDEEDDDEED